MSLDYMKSASLAEKALHKKKMPHMRAKLVIIKRRLQRRPQKIEWDRQLLLSKRRQSSKNIVAHERKKILKATRTGTSTKTAAEFLAFRVAFSCLYNSCVSFNVLVHVPVLAAKLSKFRFPLQRIWPHERVRSHALALKRSKLIGFRSFWLRKSWTWFNFQNWLSVRQ